MLRLLIILLSFTSLYAEEKPNILFLFTDDQAYDTLGVYGNPNVKTPNMDLLGKKGVIFDRHYNTTAICMASRANVMTGLYEYKTGCNFSHGPLGISQWQQSYPILLKKAGYRVGFAGKFGFSVSENPKGGKTNHEGEYAKKDFDLWAGGPGQTNFMTKKNPTIAKYADKYPHSSRAYGAVTIDFMRESVEKGQPFCMSVYYKAPHKPEQPDPMFDDIYKDTIFRKLPNYGREAGKHLSLHSQKGRQYPRFFQWGYDNDEDYQKKLRIYNQQIYGVDYSIGMILKEIDKLKIDKKTVIIFSSDNGYFNGSHGLGSKVLPYEESVRVPMIIYDPRNEKNSRRVSAITGNVDIAATIFDLAGVKIPSNCDGKSMMPLVVDNKKSIRESLPIIQVWGPEATRCLTVITQKHKYIYWYYENQKELKATEELYDLNKDSFEMKNVAKNPEYKSILEQMRKVYDLQLDHWRSDGVKYNGYPEYETLFDRKTPWSSKDKVLKKKGLGK